MVKTYICAVRVEVFSLIHESVRETNKSQIKPVMKQRWGLNRNNVLIHLEIPGVSKQHHWGKRKLQAESR